MMKFDLTTILVAILAILILCIAFMKKSAPVSEGFRRRRFTKAAPVKKSGKKTYNKITRDWEFEVVQ
jgi:hypothetical protein